MVLSTFPLVLGGFGGGKVGKNADFPKNVENSKVSLWQVIHGAESISAGSKVSLWQVIHGAESISAGFGWIWWWEIGQKCKFPQKY